MIRKGINLTITASNFIFANFMKLLSSLSFLPFVLNAEMKSIDALIGDPAVKTLADVVEKVRGDGEDLT